LIVDDEKNILLTLSQSLEVLQLETDTAINGEEALAKLKEREFGLILLDIRMPGMDGMEVLRQVREIRPDIGIIMISAYGTIELAVEAMKLGAVDFIQKPFSPEEVRTLVSRVLDRENLDERKVADYGASIELAKKSIGNRHFDAAIEHARKAIFLDPAAPRRLTFWEPSRRFKGTVRKHKKNYRAAFLSIPPTPQQSRILPGPQAGVQETGKKHRSGRYQRRIK
jgi:DNA-binding response OmpR family regulator